VQTTCTARGDGAGEEGDPDGAAVRNALQGADEVGSLEILREEVSMEEGGEREWIDAYL
jgi:hypothetical protein